jgi:hypothetical protein
MPRVCRVLLDTQAVSLFESVGLPDHESALETLQVEPVHATSKILDKNYCLTRIGMVSLVEQVPGTRATPSYSVAFINKKISRCWTDSILSTENTLPRDISVASRVMESQDQEVEQHRQHSSSTDGPTTKGPANTITTDTTKQARVSLHVVPTKQARLRLHVPLDDNHTSSS